MTAAVGHGKKAARNIDAWLRGEAYETAPKHAIVNFETLNLPVFLDADRRQPRVGVFRQARLVGPGAFLGRPYDGARVAE